MLDRLLVLALGERVDRADALAPPLEPLQPGLELRRAPRRRAARAGTSTGSLSEPLASSCELSCAATPRGRGSARRCTSSWVSSSPASRSRAWSSYSDCASRRSSAAACSPTAWSADSSCSSAARAPASRPAPARSPPPAAARRGRSCWSRSTRPRAAARRFVALRALALEPLGQPALGRDLADQLARAARPRVRLRAHGAAHQPGRTPRRLERFLAPAPRSSRSSASRLSRRCSASR